MRLNASIFFVHILFAIPSDSYKVEMYNFIGAKVYETNFTKQLTIDVAVVPTGIYFLRTISTNNNKQVVYKIVVE